MTKDQSYVAEQFKSSYNRLFSEFQKQVLIEYAAIKADYIQEYQENYRINILEKDANIEQTGKQIEEYQQTSLELYD